MITVVTPAQHHRLTTVQAVRDRLGLASDEANDDRVRAMIELASQMARDFCRRGFGRETVRQVSCGRGSWGSILLERSPAVVGSVQVGGVALQPADYTVDPDTNRLVGTSTSWCGWGGSVEITYQAGWILPEDTGANLPAVIEHAALLLIAATRAMEERGPLVKSETVDGVGSSTFWVPGGADVLPDPQAERLLQPYRTYL